MLASPSTQTEVYLKLIIGINYFSWIINILTIIKLILVAPSSLKIFSIEIIIIVFKDVFFHENCVKIMFSMGCKNKYSIKYRLSKTNCAEVLFLIMCFEYFLKNICFTIITVVIVTVGTPFDYETQSRYEVGIKITDNTGETAYSSTGTLTVSILDSNDVPIIVNLPHTVTPAVPENSAGSIFSVSVSDVDAPAQSFTFFINYSPSTPANAFYIDSTGEKYSPVQYVYSRHRLLDDWLNSPLRIAYRVVPIILYEHFIYK